MVSKTNTGSFEAMLKQADPEIYNFIVLEIHGARLLGAGSSEKGVKVLISRYLRLISEDNALEEILYHIMFEVAREKARQNPE